MRKKEVGKNEMSKKNLIVRKKVFGKKPFLFDFAASGPTDQLGTSSSSSLSLIVSKTQILSHTSGTDNFKQPLDIFTAYISRQGILDHLASKMFFLSVSKYTVGRLFSCQADVWLALSNRAS